MLSKLVRSAVPFVVSSTAAYFAKAYAILYLRCTRLEDNADLMRQIESAGGYTVVPPSFVYKPQQQVRSAITSYLLERIAPAAQSAGYFSTDASARPLSLPFRSQPSLSAPVFIGSKVELIATPAPISPKAEPIATPAPVTSKAEPTATRAPISPKAEPIATPAPITSKAEPIANLAPITQNAEPIPTPAPITQNAEPIATPAPITSKAEPIATPAPITSKPASC